MMIEDWTILSFTILISRIIEIMNTYPDTNLSEPILSKPKRNHLAASYEVTFQFRLSDCQWVRYVAVQCSLYPYPLRNSMFKPDKHTHGSVMKNHTYLLIWDIQTLTTRPIYIRSQSNFCE